jgi:Uma2 family endonuclease
MEAMGTRTLMSLEEFERLPDDGMRHELNEGELVSVTHPKFRHTWIVQNINERLSRFVNERGLGRVLSEAAYLPSADPPTLRVPDVSFVRRERLGQPPPDDYFEGAPDLAVEIVWPSDSAEDLDLKVDQYLEAGSKVVWVVYPSTRRIHVYHPDGATEMLADGQDLEARALFPGWSVRVADLLD